MLKPLGVDILESPMILENKDNTGLCLFSYYSPDDIGEKVGRNPHLTILNRNYPAGIIKRRASWNNKQENKPKFCTIEEPCFFHNGVTDFIEDPENREVIEHYMKAYNIDAMNNNLKEQISKDIQSKGYKSGFKDEVKRYSISLQNIRAFEERIKSKTPEFLEKINYGLVTLARPEILVIDIDEKIEDSLIEELLKSNIHPNIIQLEQNTLTGKTHIFFKTSNKNEYTINVTDALGSSLDVDIFMNASRIVQLSGRSNNYELVYINENSEPYNGSIKDLLKEVFDILQHPITNNQLLCVKSLQKDIRKNKETTIILEEENEKPINDNSLWVKKHTYEELNQEDLKIFSHKIFKNARHEYRFKLISTLSYKGWSKEDITALIMYITTRSNGDTTDALQDVKNNYDNPSSESVGGLIQTVKNHINNHYQKGTEVKPGKEILKFFFDFFNHPTYSDTNETIVYDDTDILNAIKEFSKNEQSPAKQKELTKILHHKYNMFAVNIKEKDKITKHVYRIDEKFNTYIECDHSFVSNWCIQNGINPYAKTRSYYDILDRIGNTKDIQDNYIELHNCFIKKDDYTTIYKDKDTNIFTNDRLLYHSEDTNNKRPVLFEYDENLQFDSITSGEIKPEYTLQQFMKITIPRQDPKNTQLCLYFLQRLGQCICGRTTISKRFDLMYDKGNRGKSALMNIFMVIFGEENTASLNNKTFNDNFLINSLKQGNNLLYGDEIQVSLINQHKETIKEITNGYKYQGRGMYEEKQTAVYNAPLFFSTNTNPALDVSDVALVKRCTLIQLPNTFKEKPDTTKNEYKIDTTTGNKIKQDFKGLNQLINIAINEYKKILEENKGWAINQSEEFKIRVMTMDEPVLQILKRFTSPTPCNTTKGEWTSNKELIQLVETKYKEIFHNNVPPEWIKPKYIGEMIMKLYPQLFGTKELKKQNKINYKGIRYNISIKNEKELEKYKHTNIDITRQDSMNIIDDKARVVYKKIKEGYKTKNQLENELDMNELEIHDCLNYLEKNDFIEFTPDHF